MSKEYFDKARKLLTELESYEIGSAEELEKFRVLYLGSKNTIKNLMVLIKDIDPDQKKEFGLLVNDIKQKAKDRFEREKAGLSSSEEKLDVGDLTRPGEPVELGARHPISIVRKQIIEVFTRIGFTVSEGPEIEDDWHNFGALNIPDDHPARDMQDTFFLEKDPDIVLRTHTSSVQVRVMEMMPPPIRTISPGRVYRNETISARAHCFFHQVEGLFIDKDVSFADLKQTLYYFATEMFGTETKIRLRPSYFPFTEPSGEMDISCLICKGKGCSVCKHSGWVEILGCGMVDPQVLKNCKIDDTKYSGYAFGMGIDRITMLKYRINDIRLFSENDVRFLKQFTALDVS